MKKIYVLTLALFMCLSCNSQKFGAGVIPSTVTAATITASTSLVASTGLTIGAAAVTPVSDGVLQRTDNGVFTWSNAKAYYGDGSDGVGTFDGTATPAGATKNSSTSYTLTRDVYYTSVTVGAAVLVSTNGYRLFNTGKETLNSVSGCNLDNSGGNGANGAGGVAAGGTGGVANSLGGTATTSVGGPAGSAGSSPVQSFAGNGGAGGGATAGAGGTVTTLNSLRPRQVPEAVSGFMAGTIPAVTGNNKYYEGGAGGGGGTNTGTNGGGGGGGGGVVVNVTQIIAGTGSICANGGKGGNASGADGPGGGGGGGVVILITNDATSWSGSNQVNGGAAGTGGAGAAPVAGSTGFTTTISG